METIKIAREYKEEVLNEWRSRDAKKKKEWSEFVEEHRFKLRRSAERLITRAKIFLSGEFGVPSAKDNHDLIFYAVGNDFYGVRNWLLKFGENPGVSNYQNETDGKTALHIACKHSNLRMVQLLIQRQADPDIRDRFGCTALHYACASGAIDCAEHLLHHGAEVDALDKFKITPLMRAAEIGDADIVELLFEYAASPNLVDKIEKWSALHYGAKGGSEPVIRALLKNGADFALYSHTRQNAQSIALDYERKEVAILLGKWRKKKLFPTNKMTLADFDEDLDI